MTEQTQPLVGDVQTQFTFGKEEDYLPSIERARVEQEQICGYPLVYKGSRQTHYKDANDNDVYEVFATFAPAPPPPPADGTQV